MDEGWRPGDAAARFASLLAELVRLAPDPATVEQTEQFLAAYEHARGRPWTAEEDQAWWAAGLWVRAFNAKKQRMGGGGPHLDRLAAEVGERAERAGLRA